MKFDTPRSPQSAPRDDSPTDSRPTAGLGEAGPRARNARRIVCTLLRPRSNSCGGWSKVVKCLGQ
eukprot:980822-Prymnesium_polylepis.1